MNTRFRFGLRFLFIVTTLAAFGSLAAAAAWPTVVQLWTGVAPLRYIPEVAARYNLFRNAVQKGDYASAESMLTSAYRRQLQQQKTSLKELLWDTPEPIRSKNEVKGRGNVAVIVFTSADLEYDGDGDYYYWQKIDGEWYISRIEFVYSLS